MPHTEHARWPGWRHPLVRFERLEATAEGLTRLPPEMTNSPYLLQIAGLRHVLTRANLPLAIDHSQAIGHDAFCVANRSEHSTCSEFMQMIDYSFRYDPAQADPKPHPSDAASARLALLEGNRRFSRWMGACGGACPAPSPPQYIVPCGKHEVGLPVGGDGWAAQKPFALVVGCADARVPVELLFGQCFNDLFTIRVAGNGLADVCLASIDFALGHFPDLRALVVLGHSGCGAVKAAVSAYLNPVAFWATPMSPMLRTLVKQTVDPVRIAANGLRQVWGDTWRDDPTSEAALIESAVAVNAAQAALELRQFAERVSKTSAGTFFGVHNIRRHQVSMPVDPAAPLEDSRVNLAPAPASAQQVQALGVEMAELLKPKSSAAASAKTSA